MDKEDREGAPTDSLPPVYPRALRHGHLLLENRSETLCSPRCRHLQGQRLLAIDPGPRCKSGAEGRAGWRCSPPALGAACSRLGVAAASDSSIPPRFPSRRHPSRTGLPGSLLLPPPRGAGRCPVPVPLGCTWLLLSLPPIDAGGGPPAPSPSTPRQARSCRPEFALQFLWQRGKKKKTKKLQTFNSAAHLGAF